MPSRSPRRSPMIGRSYLDPGDRYGRYDPPEEVTVVVAWGPGGGPRNVAVRRPDGSVQVVPFSRRLRRLPEVSGA